jgi:hypothetical protein
MDRATGAPSRAPTDRTIPRRILRTRSAAAGVLYNGPCFNDRIYAIIIRKRFLACGSVVLHFSLSERKNEAQNRKSTTLPKAETPTA